MEGKTLYFGKDDFFNEYEMQNFVKHLSKISEKKDIDTYMKKAIINRVMIDIQAENEESYENLMGYTQSKGIDEIIRLIEKREEKTQSIDENKIEEIVLRILEGRKEYNQISVIKEETKEKKNIMNLKPKEDRKKPSSRLKDL